MQTKLKKLEFWRHNLVHLSQMMIIKHVKVKVGRICVCDILSGGIDMMIYMMTLWAWQN